MIKRKIFEFKLLISKTLITSLNPSRRIDQLNFPCELRVKKKKKNKHPREASRQYSETMCSFLLWEDKYSPETRVSGRKVRRIFEKKEIQRGTKKWTLRLIRYIFKERSWFKSAALCLAFVSNARIQKISSTRLGLFLGEILRIR